MKLTHSCIVTEHVDRLRSFYADVLQIEPSDYGRYAEFPTDGGIFALFSLEGQELLAPGSMRAGSNGSIILEFQVADVDQEYERLQRLGVEWVKHPTTQPWGNRSIYFRDPDGNLINFYTRVDPVSG